MIGAVRRYFLLTGALSLGYGSIYTLLADLRDTYGFTEAQLGIITGAGFFAGFLAQVVLARQADRGHTATMVRGGLLFAAIAMLSCALATQLWAFIAGRVLLGLGSGMAGPALRRLVILREPDKVGANLGVQMSWDLTGFVLGPTLAAVLAEAGGLRTPFLVFGLLFVALLVQTANLDLRAEADVPVDAVDTGLLRNRSILATLVASIAFYVTIGVFESVWSVLLRDHGAETWLIGLTLSLFTVPMIFLAPIGGRLAQRRGPLRTVALSISLATLCTFSYGAFDVLWVLLVVSLVHAMADSFTMPGNQVAVAIAAPRHRLAAAQGLLGATGLATAGIVGLGAGAVYEHAGAFVLFSGTAALMALCLAIALVLGRELLAPPVVAGPEPLPVEPF
ncbi:MAG: putative major facilitator superfamily transporter [Actinomycetia bacterium]|nr:putative major facilitator superfamily transporter [Actinomycetes bacterium]